MKKTFNPGPILPNLVPGVPDPLPDPVRPPIEADWPCREEVRIAHVKAFRQLMATQIPPPEDADGSGVVYVGGGDYWPGIVVGIKMLRRVSSLPVQVWYRGAEEEIDADDLAGVKDVLLVNASTFFRQHPRIMGGWELKTLALLNCGFERALYLDADAYCVSDPGAILDYLDKEAFAFWQDHDGHWRNINWWWYGLCDKIGPKPPPVQGGQFAIHLRKFRRELVLAHWLNQHSDYTYHWSTTDFRGRHGYGDQDQWRIALFATKGKALCLGRAKINGPAMVCDNEGIHTIVHRVQCKLAWQGTDMRTEHLPGDRQVFTLLDQYQLRRLADRTPAIGT